VITYPPPVENPLIVTFLGLPPKALMLSRTHVKGGDLILHGEVRRPGAGGGQRGWAKTPRAPSSVVEGDDDDAVLHPAARILAGRAEGVGAAMDVDHDREVVALLELIGALTLRYRQSSWLSGSPAVGAAMTELRRVEGAVKLVGTGGIQRSSPSGGLAKGMPRHSRMLRSSLTRRAAWRPTARSRPGRVAPGHRRASARE
jgi:hypothetical protein